MKKICTKEIPTHEQASKILKQLKTNPEICDKCKIKPCSFAVYTFERVEV